jgi:hypothetical protein
MKTIWIVVPLQKTSPATRKKLVYLMAILLLALKTFKVKVKVCKGKLYSELI